MTVQTWHAKEELDPPNSENLVEDPDAARIVTEVRMFDWNASRKVLLYEWSATGSDHFKWGTLRYFDAVRILATPDK